MKNTDKLKEIISEFESGLTHLHKEMNVIPLKGGMPKDVMKEQEKSLETVLFHLKAALDQINKTRNSLVQKAMVALSEEQMVGIYQELNDCAEQFNNGTVRDLLLNSKDEKNAWAELILMYHELQQHEQQ